MQNPKRKGKDYSAKRKQMRDLYIDGMPVEEIASLFQLDVRTIHYHKNVDLKKHHCDWEQLRLESMLGEEHIEGKNQAFLAALIECFEQELQQLKSEPDPDKRLKRLERYANGYHKLVAAGRTTEPGAQIHDIAATVLRTLATMAKDTGRLDVVEFVLERMDAICDHIRKHYGHDA